MPLALVQILHDLTPEQQDEWMATAGHRKLLGEHPLFVKPYNREQRLVLDRVRQDNGAVVQGPPGTGKTHTIANLLVAMLAEGLRVLVVSQREHPLRVVRSMLPPELQNMCVSLAGGKRGRTSALEACVRAMSEYLASTTDEQAAARVESCRERWNSARQAVSDAEAALAVSRESEYTEHPPVAPGYHGRLAEIASAVQERRSEFGWLPSLPASASATCPLGALELAQLLALLRAHPDGPRRADQSVPPVEHVHDPAQIAQLFRDLEAPEVAPRVRDIADRCAGAGPAELDEWLKDLDRLREILRHLGERARSSGERWLVVAVGDLLAGQNLNAWRELVERDPSAERLSARSRNPVLRDVGFPGADPAALRELREEAEALARGLRDGQPVRTRVFRSLTGLGRETAHVREHCTYRQREPKTAESAAAVWDLLDILATLTDLEHAWSFVVPLEAPPADPGLRLRWLAQAEAVLPMLGELGNIAIRLRYRLAQKQILAVLTTEESWLVFRDGVALARARIDLAANEEFHAKLLTWWEHIASAADAAPELKTVTDALRDRDINAFRTAVAGVEQARATIESHRQLRELAGRLDDAHPEFLAELKASGQDERWGERCAAAEEAWTWAAAERFVRGQYRPGLDAEQEAALVAAKKELRSAAEELATAQAWASCLSTMDSSARRALRSYPYYAQRQGGQGKHAAQHRKSARSAISEAMPAVPAWVMPIDKVAELLQAEQNSFDVVIVDEASQASPTSLFLLWLAPRVIVVGDDKQCMPYSSTRGLESVSERLKGDFPDAPDHVREMLLPNGNLYDILSTAFPSVVRLREHFRCMPEIISWSSKEFYDGALVPLRQHGADRLEPVQIRFVPNGQAAGSSDTLVNRAEAEHVVDLLSERLADPAYDGKSFGVIAMQSPKQVKVLDQLIQKRIPASEIDARDIRAGSAQSFQGDERDVMVLSTVAAGRTQTLRDHSSYDRRLNVAASRAKDQLVIVTSLGEDLDPEDIRHRMFSHYQELEDTPLEVLDISRMSPEWLAAPFRSLFVQRVYLAVRSRGYDADAGVDIGGRTLDIVVHGRERSVAVICDEYRGLSAERRHRDDESLRELSRAGWPFCRVVHSQFVLDPDEALDVVWAALDAEQIEAAEA
ncbi:AAA domain-containing protein [Amycolatopsis sp. NPDC023774]|uniref:AAA domain-containing protein n=1 Tax=Amycolatopsis sp. NPDC023774 TaxID=3155015 RepID=UPI0033E3EE84